MTAAQDKPLPGFAIIDMQKILRESLAAKSVVPQMQKLRIDYQQEVRRQEEQLRTAERELIQQRAILAPEAYAKRRQEFEDLRKQAQRSVQNRKRLLERSVNTAMRKVRIKINELAREVAKERKIDLVLHKSIVEWSADNLDITPEILNRLNKRLPSVTVVVEEKR